MHCQLAPARAEQSGAMAAELGWLVSRISGHRAAGGGLASVDPACMAMPLAAKHLLRPRLHASIDEDLLRHNKLIRRLYKRHREGLEQAGKCQTRLAGCKT